MAGRKKQGDFIYYERCTLDKKQWLLQKSKEYNMKALLQATPSIDLKDGILNIELKSELQGDLELIIKNHEKGKMIQVCNGDIRITKNYETYDIITSIILS